MPSFLSHAEPKPWTCKSQLAQSLWIGAKEKTLACTICSCTTTPLVYLHISTSNCMLSLLRRNFITNWTTYLPMFFNLAMSLLSSFHNLLAWSEAAQMLVCLRQDSVREVSPVLSLLILFLEFKGIRTWALGSCVKHTSRKAITK